MSVQVATERAGSLPWGLVTSDPGLVARARAGLAEVEDLLLRCAHS